MFLELHVHFALKTNKDKWCYFSDIFITWIVLDYVILYVVKMMIKIFSLSELSNAFLFGT